jgi:hypothetical protein
MNHICYLKIEPDLHGYNICNIILSLLQVRFMFTPFLSGLCEAQHALVRKSTPPCASATHATALVLRDDAQPGGTLTCRPLYASIPQKVLSIWIDAKNVWSLRPCTCVRLCLSYRRVHWQLHWLAWQSATQDVVLRRAHMSERCMR